MNNEAVSGLFGGLQTTLWPLAALLLGLAAALLTHLLLGALLTTLARQRQRRSRVQRYLVQRNVNRLEQVGEAFAQAAEGLGLRPLQGLERLCRLRNLTEPPEKHQTSGYVLGLGLLLLLPALALLLVLQDLLLVPVGLALAALPLLSVRSAAGRNRKKLRRSLPELASLLAGEAAVSTPLEEALTRAATWGAVSAPLISEAVTRARTAAAAAALFSRVSDGGQTQRLGTLAVVATEFGEESWRSFTLQLDAIALQGVGVPAALQRMAAHMVTENRAELEEAAEKLEDRLMLPLIICFMPAVLIITIVPLAIPIMESF